MWFIAKRSWLLDMLATSMDIWMNVREKSQWPAGVYLPERAPTHTRMLSLRN